MGHFGQADSLSMNQFLQTLMSNAPSENDRKNKEEVMGVLQEYVNAIREYIGIKDPDTSIPEVARVSWVALEKKGLSHHGVVYNVLVSMEIILAVSIHHSGYPVRIELASPTTKMVKNKEELETTLHHSLSNPETLQIINQI